MVTLCGVSFVAPGRHKKITSDNPEYLRDDLGLAQDEDAVQRLRRLDLERLGTLLARGGWTFQKAPKAGGRTCHLEAFDLVVTPPAGARRRSYRSGRNDRLGDQGRRWRWAASAW